ncbi:MAG: helix-turn-helix domain-containing protein [Thermoanaerobaculales bacterium]
MSDDHLDEQGQELRGKLDRERRRAGGSHRWRCSEALRLLVVTYAVACSANGESHSQTASRLGLTQSTVSRWIREAPGAGSAVREVAIVPAVHESATPPRSPAPVRLVTPHGFIVEGLDSELLVSLLRVLG